MRFVKQKHNIDKYRQWTLRVGQYYSCIAQDGIFLQVCENSQFILKTLSKMELMLHNTSPNPTAYGSTFLF